MDSEHWISRLAAAKRFYAAQLGHADRGAGMDELDMDEDPPAAATTPEFACPYCYEDHDVASLCAHLEEDHPFEAHAAELQVEIWFTSLGYTVYHGLHNALVWQMIFDAQMGGIWGLGQCSSTGKVDHEFRR